MKFDHLFVTTGRAAMPWYLTILRYYIIQGVVKYRGGVVRNGTHDCHVTVSKTMGGEP